MNPVTLARDRAIRLLAIILGVAFLSTQLTPPPVYADDDDPTPSPNRCKKGYVWSSSKRKCVRKTSEVLTDDDLYQQARAHAVEGEYHQALNLLWRIKDQKQGRVLTYIGYASRKLGRIDEAIDYYRQALAIRPDYNSAREYLGKGYLQKGDLAKANEQLSTIKASCGTNCKAYEQLAKNISAYAPKQN